MSVALQKKQGGVAMTTRSLVSKLAAIVAALIVVFLPEEVFLTLWEETVWLCIVTNLIVAIAGWEFILLYVEKFRSFFGRVTKVIITHQIIGVGEKGLDAIMIFLIVGYGPALTFLVVTPIYFIYCMFVVMAYDFFLDKGYDLLELENLRINGDSEDFNGFFRWVMKKRITIFLVGSFFQLDPDGVTILLRKNREMFWKNSIKITLPSTLISMTVWTTVYSLAVKGFEWARWIIE